MAQTNYPPPTYLCNQVAGTGVQAGVIDIGPFMATGLPPVVQIVISATATVYMRGSCGITTAGTLISPLDAPAGGVTSSGWLDLPPGIRFWQVNITANTGTVTVFCGSCPMGGGELATPSLVQFTTATTQQTGI